MPSYNLDSIKAALAKGDKKSDAKAKNNYWKPELGTHDVRFMPIESATGEPFLRVQYYETLSERRFVAPSCFGLPDPVSDAFETLRKKKENWPIAKNLRPRERFYAVVMVRGEEDKGPRVWEMSADLRKKIYDILLHKDNVDEDMFSSEVGYDFTVTVSPLLENGKPKTFKGHPMKDISLQARKKPSPLCKDKSTAAAWIAAIPNLEETFKAQCKSPEELIEILENYLASTTAGEAPSADGTDHNPSSPSTAKVAEDKLDSAFADLS